MRENLTIKCPQCGESFPLDETLAGPMIAEVRAEANKLVLASKREAEEMVNSIKSREGDIAAKEKALADREASVQSAVNQAIAQERVKIAETERENIRKELAPELQAEKNRATDLAIQLESAKKAELALRQQKADLEQRENSLEIEVARKVDDQRNSIREETLKEAEAKANLQLQAKDLAISAAQEKIEALLAKENQLASKEKELADREASIASKVNEAIAIERLQIAQVERENVIKELRPELDAEKLKAQKLSDQLATSQKAELELRQQRDELELRSNSLDLEVARKVDAQRSAIQEQALKDADEKTRLRIAEKDKTILDMQLKLEEAQRKATQGSQQMQGEVLELDFESTLRQFFPQDTIEPVKSGARGGDVLQRVLGEMGRYVGTMFWETKRAQSWGGDWASKAKQNATEAKAEIAIIVSEVLPKGIHDFGPYEGVWVTRQSHSIVLGIALRQGVMTTADARQGVLGKESKMERLYAYMIGNEFRSILEGIALPFQELHNELISEQRTTKARWKRQERRIERVLDSVAAMQGDLKGIAGSEMPELPGFEAVVNTDEEEDK